MKRHLSLVLLFSGLLSMVAFDLRGADLGLGLSDGEGAIQENHQEGSEIVTVESPAEERQPIVWEDEVRCVRKKYGRSKARATAKADLSQKTYKNFQVTVAESRDSLDAKFEAAKARGDKEAMQAVRREKMRLARVAAAGGRHGFVRPLGALNR